jgi:hypothetical protein
MRSTAIAASTLDPVAVVPFFAEADAMRAAFDERVGPSRTVGPERFVWDYWHVPGQYSYFRTPARRFFPPDVYRRFVAALREWGDLHLGAVRITEPWLSWYIDGCRQELHSDVVQGPWAFVFSLTRWDERRFTGGETVLARPALLNYWASFDERCARETDALLTRLPVRFNQLTVFDTRLPHGVAPVAGTHDPVQSRVVVHGWFLPPTLSARGGLHLSALAEPIERLREEWRERVGNASDLTGLAVWRLRVAPDGTVADVTLVVDTVVPTSGAASPPTAVLLSQVRERLAATRFPASSADTLVTLPLTITGA